ncbi:amino-acid N-acetyltransferase [Myceligenerans crystallogenes]|uniref:amino-acid N-acetyltransferase n=1 Tax=Myceligenerans crystallogenes TaxID=316335 RepID=UPI0031E48536
MTVNIRPALPADVRAIRALVEPYAERRILLAKEWVGYYEAVQEFLVAESPGGPEAMSDDDGARLADRAGGGGAPGSAAAEPVEPAVVGCGALHVMWEDLAEIRTLAVHPGFRGQRLGHRLVEALLDRARSLGLNRVFCLTFEVEFFRKHGFEEIDSTPVSPDVYAELLRSHDDGVAEFLDLARVKPNTLGNSRMLLEL